MLSTQEAKVLQMLAAGMTQAEVAAELGVTQQRVSAIKIRAGVYVRPPDPEVLRADLMAQLDRARETAERIMAMPGAPVTRAVGSDLIMVRDPEFSDGEGGAIVRDYSAQLAAIREVVRVQQRIAAMFGLDAATKTESAATVRHEVVGVPGVEEMLT